jgi:hypothetical protein
VSVNITDLGLLKAVQGAKQTFGIKCSKMSGAVTVEIFRSALAAYGLRTSHRDVFILGVPVEFDLLIPRQGAVPRHSLIFDPSEVLAVLEVKNSGSFGDTTLAATRRAFELAHAANIRIYCAYVTLAERKGFRWAATRENIGADAYTLFWHTGTDARREYESSGDWSRLVDTLSTLSERAPSTRRSRRPENKI